MELLEQPEIQDQAPAAPAPGVEIVNGKEYMRDSDGVLMPIAKVKPMDRLEDELVRKMIGFARPLSAEVTRFRGHCYDDVGSLQALVAQEYGAPLGGKKGNISLTSYDGTLKVQVQVADHLEFGPQLQAAKRLVDACLAEWSENAPDELRAVVTRAFNVDKEGLINRSAIFMLLRIASEDERWQEAMRAVRDSIRVIGSKTYFRFYERDSPDGAWRAISIDLARA